VPTTAFWGVPIRCAYPKSHNLTTPWVDWLIRWRSWRFKVSHRRARYDACGGRRVLWGLVGALLGLIFLWKFWTLFWVERGHLLRIPWPCEYEWVCCRRGTIWLNFSAGKWVVFWFPSATIPSFVAHATKLWSSKLAACWLLIPAPDTRTNVPRLLYFWPSRRRIMWVYWTSTMAIELGAARNTFIGTHAVFIETFVRIWALLDCVASCPLLSTYYPYIVINTPSDH